MNDVVAIRLSYFCAAAAGGLLALHFNAELFPSWSPRLALISAVFALVGVALAVFSLGRRGWTSMRSLSAQIALALNAFLALAFLFYAQPAA